LLELSASSFRDRNPTMPMPILRIRPPIVLCLFTLAGPASAAPMQDLEAVRTAVHRHIESLLGPGVSIDVTRPDPRLRLARCTGDLEVFEQGRAIAVGTNTLGVRCPGQVPWTIYLSAKVSQLVPVLVATRPLSPGHVITAEDLALVSQDQGQLRQNTLANPTLVIGRVVSRPMSAGMPVTAQHIAEATTVRRGEKVTIRAGGSGLAVETPGKALADGAPGSRIRVENLRSRRVVEGVVGPDRVIDVSM
jgi:flagella basal body P-ring formation protein FlgA